MNPNKQIIIIGGGLAGCEAAWQIANRNIGVKLYEMKPHKYSPAHSSSKLAELVCSNSFRSDKISSAVGLLKEEMRLCNSLIMKVANETAVPAGQALAVDRELFAEKISEIIENHPLIEVVKEEIHNIPSHSDTPKILATGPLSSTDIINSLIKLTGDEHLAFYDAIAPIVADESLNREIIYSKSRYEDGDGDYLNCPFNKEEYLKFITAIKEADKVALKSFEEPKYFEGCLPIEVMIERGDDTLRYGPMKPVGLPDPRTGKDPYAVIQLRKENLDSTSYNLVGFQTKLTYSEQKRIFKTIPGMENADFIRFGSIHRNTFICAPEILKPTLQFKSRNDLLLAGQLSGVEGYVESTAMGLLAGINSSKLIKNQPLVVPPPETALGALIVHLTKTEPKNFQPSNINFGLFPAWKKKVKKRFRGGIRAEIALKSLEEWMAENDILNTPFESQEVK